MILSTRTIGSISTGTGWTDQTLDDYFKGPAKAVSENTMAYDGKIEHAVQCRHMIAGLKMEDPTVQLCH